MKTVGILILPWLGGGLDRSLFGRPPPAWKLATAES